MLAAQRLDELDVQSLLAVGSQDAQVSTSLVQRFGSLAQTAHETVSADGSLEHSSQCFINVHLASGLAGRLGDGGGELGLFISAY